MIKVLCILKNWSNLLLLIFIYSWLRVILTFVSIGYYLFFHFCFFFWLWIIIFASFLQAESAIAALSCSGVVLGSLPIRLDQQIFLSFHLPYKLNVPSIIRSYVLVCRVSPSKTPVRARAVRTPMHWIILHVSRMNMLPSDIYLHIYTYIETYMF